MRGALLCLLAGVVLTTAGAFADDLPSALRLPQATGHSCAALQRQFDQAIAARANLPNAPTARRLRQTGEQKCNGGHYPEGVKDLAKALHYINLQPTMP